MPDAVAAAVAVLLEANPELTGRRLTSRDWTIELPGTVRRVVRVALRAGDQTVQLSNFLLRGPRSAERAALLHRLLLRRNTGLRRIRLGLDQDDDVVVLASIPMAVFATELDAVLAEILSLTESVFEALVHLAYPGVFPPLQTPPGISPRPEQRFGRAL